MTIHLCAGLALLAVAVLGASASGLGAEVPPTASSTPSSGTTTVSLEELHQCGEQTAYETNQDLLGAIDVKEVLLQHGGPAGQVVDDKVPRVDPADLPPVWGNVTRYEHFSYFFAELSIVSNVSLSDNATFIRVEKKTRTMSIGLPVLPMPLAENDSAGAAPSTTSTSPPPPPPVPVVEERVTGEIWWRPADLCGYLRSAEYGVYEDPASFWAEVKRRHCLWEAGELRCFGPDADFVQNVAFGSASPALIATLVGK